MPLDGRIVPIRQYEPVLARGARSIRSSWRLDSGRNLDDPSGHAADGAHHGTILPICRCLAQGFQLPGGDAVLSTGTNHDIWANCKGSGVVTDCFSPGGCPPARR